MHSAIRGRHCAALSECIIASAREEGALSSYIKLLILQARKPVTNNTSSRTKSVYLVLLKAVETLLANAPSLPPPRHQCSPLSVFSAPCSRYGNEEPHRQTDRPIGQLLRTNRLTLCVYCASNTKKTGGSSLLSIRDKIITCVHLHQHTAGWHWPR
jgi:hypothetical protein